MNNNMRGCQRKNSNRPNPEATTAKQQQLDTHQTKGATLLFVCFYTAACVNRNKSTPLQAKCRNGKNASDQQLKRKIEEEDEEEEERGGGGEEAGKGQLKIVKRT
ncbi:hypothetical protein T4A_5425 [Trichinella pseudospiralis]|uniref:Uncharacterized protein n=1 Tax=Trichinella pseudospiralis TaxID=6337 RepID=A0A0V1E406_TRIPS|nr:hypothetical protein T4A_5425 [Trichinella pseudospiralis]KRZ37368.1 hypothetical protein T4C_13607 [Trichinella pseudospiralis]